MNIFKNIPFLADIITILSFLITLYLLFGVRKIRREFKNLLWFKARIPELRKSLEEGSREMEKR